MPVTARSLVFPLTCAFAANAAAQQEAPQETKTPTVEERLSALEKASGGDTMRAYWKDGLRFETQDKRYKFKLGGRIHYDVGFFDGHGPTLSYLGHFRRLIRKGGVLITTNLDFGGEASRYRTTLSDPAQWTTSFAAEDGRTAISVRLA